MGKRSTATAAERRGLSARDFVVSLKIDPWTAGGRESVNRCPRMLALDTTPVGKNCTAPPQDRPGHVRRHEVARRHAYGSPRECVDGVDYARPPSLCASAQRCPADTARPGGRGAICAGPHSVGLDHVSLGRNQRVGEAKRSPSAQSPEFQVGHTGWSGGQPLATLEATRP